MSQRCLLIVLDQHVEMLPH